jgi:predicted PurR-regulated permease PerM
MDPSPLIYQPALTTLLWNIVLMLLIPVVVLMVVLLVQVVMIAAGVKNLLHTVQYEIMPVIKELRLTAEHLEAISAKAASSVESVQRGLQATGPMLKQGASSLKDASKNIAATAVSYVTSMLSGIRKSYLSPSGQTVTTTAK